MLRTTSVFVILAMLSVQMLASHHHHHHHSHHHSYDEESSEHYQHLHENSKKDDKAKKDDRVAKSTKNIWYAKNSIWLGYCLIVPRVPASACFQKLQHLDKDLKVHKLLRLKKLKELFPKGNGKLTKEQRQKIKTFFQELSGGTQKIMKDAASLKEGSGKVGETLTWYLDSMNVKDTKRHKELMEKYKALSKTDKKQFKKRVQFLKLIFRKKGMKHVFWSKNSLTSGKSVHLDQQLGQCAAKVQKLPDLTEVRSRIYAPVFDLGKAGVALGEVLHEILADPKKYC